MPARVERARDLDANVKAWFALEGYERREDGAWGKRGSFWRFRLGFEAPHVGRCKPCKRPVRVERSVELNDRAAALCPACNQWRYVSMIRARLAPDVKCSGICRSATGPSCSCSCGGANHGKG